ncbi:hypothetical protein B0H66DRAFT_587959 [Apodospora peruviana]|uniref:Uncharacterized protein n=1 Tax=Apodospora peruviana TaxID=516989 RepID=A0AAE0IHA8_9PEZI|nr:hypothetical protein B0H66DRAFT_587959 [Apodospora peruviana]
MSLSYQEPDHDRDWHDLPDCAQPCLLSKTDGYWSRSCDRSSGRCCPGADKDIKIKHFDVWDCVLQRCSRHNHVVAQAAADIFMRECAVKGYPLPANLTLNIPSAIVGDHFPAQYEYKDFVTPVQGVSISGFYGWGCLLVYAVTLIAATFAGIRPSSRSSRPDRVSSVLTSVFRVPRRWLWYLRRDADLLAALAVPCVAAGDIRLRLQRVTFHQVFTYGDPSFVPVSDGADVATDVLTIRAAIVIVNHFFISAFTLAALPWLALFLTTGPRRGWLRQLLRTAAISATFLWCVIAIKPLYCKESHFLADEWGGGCYMTNLFPRNAATLLRILPGVCCGSLGSAFGDVAGIFGILGVLGGLLAVAKGDGSCGERAVIFGVVSLAIFFLLYVFFGLFPYLYNSVLGMIIVTFWYLGTHGRNCSFGPSSMIGFMEIDQIFALTVGGSMGIVSIWDSISTFKEEFRANSSISSQAGLAGGVI